MKKIFKISSFLFLLTSVIFMPSCNKQDASLNAPNTVDVAQTQYKLNNVKFENGMLVFNTRADLDSAFVLLNKTKDDTKWVYKQFPQHVSHNSIFNALTKDELRLLDSSKTIPEKYLDIVKFVEFDSSRILVESVSMHPFSVFANKDGIFGVGNEVIKISSSYIYSMNKDYY